MRLSEAAGHELKLGLLGRVWHLYLWKIVLRAGICHKQGSEGTSLIVALP